MPKIPGTARSRFRKRGWMAVGARSATGIGWAILAAGAAASSCSGVWGVEPIEHRHSAADERSEKVAELDFAAACFSSHPLVQALGRTSSWAGRVRQHAILQVASANSEASALVGNAPMMSANRATKFSSQPRLRIRLIITARFPGRFQKGPSGPANQRLRRARFKPATGHNPVSRRKNHNLLR